MGCFKWYKNIFKFAFLFAFTIYLIKFLYMLGQDTFGSASDILTSEKFWAPEELFWGIAFPITVVIFMSLFLLYAAAHLSLLMCSRKTRQCCFYCCPDVYVSCCMTDVERLEHTASIFRHKQREQQPPQVYREQSSHPGWKGVFYPPPTYEMQDGVMIEKKRKPVLY